MNDSLPGLRPPRPALDQIDRRILTLLARNARLSARAIAREMDVSAGLVLDRIERLESQGVILGYRVEVDHEAAGFGVNAFVWIQMDPAVSVEDTLDYCMTIPEVEIVNWTTGEYTLFLTVRVRDYAHLQQTMLTRLRSIPGSLRMNTSIGLAHRRRVGGQYTFTWKQSMGDGGDD
ncbi:MAG: Lrp/AsnC family transcriptional regulator [Burkholderiaceae bacterium]